MSAPRTRPFFLLLLAACSAEVAPRQPQRDLPPRATASVRSVEPTASTLEPTPQEAPEAPVASTSPPPPDVTVVSPSGAFKAVTKKGTELWLESKDGPPKQLLGSGVLKPENTAANLPELENTGIGSATFSPDEQRIYFTKNGWATSGALFYVEHKTGKLFFFHDALAFEVIGKCRNKSHIGRVLVFEHSYFDIDPLGAVDLWTLLDAAEPKPDEQRTGKSGRVGLVGLGDDNLARFLALECGIGKAPAAPKGADIPSYLKPKRIPCLEQTLVRDDLVFLDKTRQVRFRFEPQPGTKPEEEAGTLSLEAAIGFCGPRPKE